MQKLTKIIFSLILVIIFLLLCIEIILTSGFFAWLRTYQAFTKERLVAEITVQALAPENGVDRMQVTYKQVAQPSAFDALLFPSNSQAGFTRELTLYGDQILIGGPVVKFENIPTLLGFESVYKVARIQGSYVDVKNAGLLPASTTQELNGGVDDTWSYFEQQSENLPWLIDTAYFSLAGKSVPNSITTYGLYITEDSFVLDRL